MAEKTEQATPKKLRDARKKGQVAKIQDLPAALTFITSIGATILFMGSLFDSIAGFTLSMFHAVSTVQTDFKDRAPSYMHEALLVIIKCCFPILLLVCLVGVISSFLIIGPVFSMEAMKFDFKKLNPIEGIKQKFKLKVLIELLKSIAKITGASLIIYFLIKGMLADVISSVLLPIPASALVVKDFLESAAIRVGIFFLFIALFDLAFQKKNFAKEMMMEKFEVKQEYKETEGDPAVKGRRREIQREIAYQEGASSAKRARVIVTNPTHIAVALQYDPKEQPAPIILTMGVGQMAEQIIKIGVENKIPIMRNVDLARSLYTKGKISDYVPEDTYEAVAEILKWIESLEKAEGGPPELFQ